ncbi:MAG TPA: dihydrofolate reductase family protein [Candidatus Acidoferrum sp.]|nr:dihydrofolate reductase family protein [Candidatus Acidoferrum sp.]
MRKLIEITHVSLGGAIGPSTDWAMPYLNDEHQAYASDQLFNADGLVLGRRTYEGLSAAYTAMPSSPFVDRMNSIPKYVASNTLHQLGWNAALITGDLAEFIARLKNEPGKQLIKYGNGSLDAVLMREGLIDEFHILLTPVAVGNGQHLFETISNAAALHLADVTTFKNGVVLLVYSS